MISSAIRWAGKLEFEVRANWKLVYENYMEGYHVFAVHPRLIKFAPMNIRWSGEWQDHVFYNDYVFPQTEGGRGEEARIIPACRRPMRSGTLVPVLSALRRRGLP